MNADVRVDEIESVRGSWLRRWWRVLLIGFALSLVVGGLLLAWQPQLYRARAALLVGTSLESLDPEPSAVQASAGLARTYADLARRPAVLQTVIDELRLERTPERLAGQVTTRVQPGSQIVEIEVVDLNAQTALAIANALARALSLEAPEGGGEVQAAMAFTSQQLAALQSSITNLEAEVQRQEAFQPQPSIEYGAAAPSNLDTLRARLDAQRTAYAALLAGYRESASNALTIVEPASASVPVRKPLLPVLAGAGLAGLVLSAAGIAVSQGLDDTLRWQGLAPGRCVGLPVLGAIGNVPPEKGSLYYPRDPSSPEAEAVRDLAANIYLTGPQTGPRSLLFTSPSRQDGKSFVAANLAVALAATGIDVVLVDAGLRQPSLHEAFRVRNDRGLSDALRDKRARTAALLRRLVRPSGQEHLALITAGPQAMEHPLALYTARLQEMLEQLKERFRFVIVDGPAAEGLAPDAGILAALADQTVLVFKSGSTREEEAQRCRQVIARRPGANIIGVVFNRALQGQSRAQEPAEAAEQKPKPTAQARTRKKAEAGAPGPAAGAQTPSAQARREAPGTSGRAKAVRAADSRPAGQPAAKRRATAQSPAATVPGRSQGEARAATQQAAPRAGKAAERKG